MSLLRIGVVSPFVQRTFHAGGECGQKCWYLNFRITDLSTVGSISKNEQVHGTLNFVKSGPMNVYMLRYVHYALRNNFAKVCRLASMSLGDPVRPFLLSKPHFLMKITEKNSPKPQKMPI